MIPCDKMAELLNGYLDRELSEEDIRHFEEHLKICSDCFGHYEFDRALRQLLQQQQGLRAKLSKDTREMILRKLGLGEPHQDE